MPEDPGAGQEDLDATFAQLVNMSVNILGQLERKLEDELAGSPNIGEIATLIKEIGGGWGKVIELIEDGTEEAVPPGQPSAQPGQ